jgi:hypothetical protein
MTREDGSGWPDWGAVRRALRGWGYPAWPDAFDGLWVGLPRWRALHLTPADSDDPEGVWSAYLHDDGRAARAVAVGERAGRHLRGPAPAAGFAQGVLDLLADLGF